jgi:hypothetical protein
MNYGSDVNHYNGIKRTNTVSNKITDFTNDLGSESIPYREPYDCSHLKRSKKSTNLKFMGESKEFIAKGKSLFQITAIGLENVQEKLNLFKKLQDNYILKNLDDTTSESLGENCQSRSTSTNSVKP